MKGGDNTWSRAEITWDDIDDLLFTQIVIRPYWAGETGASCFAPRQDGLVVSPKDQKVVSSNPTQAQTQWCLRFQKNIEISLYISHSESLCDRDYPSDPLDQKPG